jgi:CheY-like chemotaxis protein
MLRYHIMSIQPTSGPKKTILIVEDQDMAAITLTTQIGMIFADAVVVRVKDYESAKEALKSNTAFDVVFLDNNFYTDDSYTDFIADGGIKLFNEVISQMTLQPIVAICSTDSKDKFTALKVSRTFSKVIPMNVLQTFLNPPKKS